MTLRGLVAQPLGMAGARLRTLSLIFPKDIH